MEELDVILWIICSTLNILFFKYVKIINTKHDNDGEYDYVNPKLKVIGLSILKVFLIIIYSFVPLFNISVIIVLIGVLIYACSMYDTKKVLGFENKFWKFINKEL